MYIHMYIYTYMCMCNHTSIQHSSKLAPESLAAVLAERSKVRVLQATWYSHELCMHLHVWCELVSASLLCIMDTSLLSRLHTASLGAWHRLRVCCRISVLVVASHSLLYLWGHLVHRHVILQRNLQIRDPCEVSCQFWVPV